MSRTTVFRFLMLCMSTVRVTTLQVKCHATHCEITNLKTIEEAFVNRYVPKTHLLMLYTNLQLEAIGKKFIEKLPNFTTTIYIEHSLKLRMIRFPAVSLQELHVKHTSLEGIAFEENHHLTEVIVAQSRISRIPKTVRNLHALELLEISRSNIRELNIADFCENDMLSSIVLDRNKIRSIVNTASKQCKLFHTLEDFYLSSNFLLTVKLDMFNPFNILKKLDLRSNRIEQLGGSFTNNALTEFVAAGNGLKSVNVCDWNLPKLSKLTLSFNALTAIPDCLGRFKNVELLSFSANNLSYFNIDSVADMDSLTELNLSENVLSSVVLNSRRFPKMLKAIHIDNNMLTELNLSYIPVPSLQIYAQLNLISSFDINSTSPNVTVLTLFDNPMDCTWRSPLERERVQCIVQVYTPSTIVLNISAGLKAVYSN